MGQADADPTCAPPCANPTRPALELPAGSCDAHCHVFGPQARFPFTPGSSLRPPDVPRERLLALHDYLGFERAVVVQSVCHGFDHRAMIDVIRGRPDRYRGVALLHPDVTMGEIRRLAAESVCGVRLGFMPHLGHRTTIEEVRRTARLIAGVNWHMELHMTGVDLIELEDDIARLDVRVVIDHMGRIALGSDRAGEAVEALIRLVDTGNVWVKLSVPERISRGEYPYDDALTLARMLAAHAPERMVWGTDFPHPNIAGVMPDDGRQVDLISLIAPSHDARLQMLVGNPIELFGFPAV